MVCVPRLSISPAKAEASSVSPKYIPSTRIMSDTLFMIHKDMWNKSVDSIRMTRSEIFNLHILEFGSKIQNQVLDSLPLCLSNDKSWAMAKVLSPPTGLDRTSMYILCQGWILDTWCSLSPD